FYTAIVASLSDKPPGEFAVKPIMSLLDKESILRYPQLKFWKWVADYYLSPLGDVYKAAIPSGLKPESETWLSVNEDFEPDEKFSLTDNQALVLSVIREEKKKKIRLSELQEKSGIHSVTATVNRLLNMGVIEIAETIQEKYRPKTRRMIRIKGDRKDSELLCNYFGMVSRSQRQEKVLMHYLTLSKWLSANEDILPVSREELTNTEEASPGIIKALIDKGIFEEYKTTVNRFNPISTSTAPLSPLADFQQSALKEIKKKLVSYPVCLLHGVTGSGKTEIYSHLISEVLNNGDQVLFLVPEISLTTQLTDRLRKIFGNQLIVYHSKFSDAERVEIYRKLLNSVEPFVILGARSSVFLPFYKLGLVIIDEEHEPSFKQYDPAPRYNARDAAIVLAQLHHAPVLLGSATPSIETYYKASNGKFGLVTIDRRFKEARLPEVEIVDMKCQRKRKLNKGIISEPLFIATSEAMKESRQAIMFLNRRGFAPVVVCKACGWTPKCHNCDVSMVYHKHSDSLRCHYCGFSMPRPSLCPACGENAIEIFGYGTERIAEELMEAFPDNRIARMDLDSTRNRNSYQELIENFSRHDTDILVGTQMVAKGLDFEKVDIVGVLNADTILNFPDFRSNERAFNMIEQVAGRAGRREKLGKVFIQTTDPKNPVLSYVASHDYHTFYKTEIEDRKKYHYPPFTRIINVYLKNKDSSTVDRAAVTLTHALRNVFGDRVLGPEKPFVSRVATYYLRTIMIKIETEASMIKVKYILRNIYESLARSSEMKTTQIYYDVDPV
ncbi:MAG: primosomal protein N', partial [Muribaculaceae bacterium]|nr:primosomal protein N' [Muribaculaceae bacterium]